LEEKVVDVKKEQEQSLAKKMKKLGPMQKLYERKGKIKTPTRLGNLV